MARIAAADARLSEQPPRLGVSGVECCRARKRWHGLRQPIATEQQPPLGEPRAPILRPAPDDFAIGREGEVVIAPFGEQRSAVQPDAGVGGILRHQPVGRGDALAIGPHDRSHGLLVEYRHVACVGLHFPVADRPHENHDARAGLEAHAGDVAILEVTHDQLRAGAAADRVLDGKPGRGKAVRAGIAGA